MTLEERAEKLLRDTVKEVSAMWTQEMVNAPLNEEGDETRRLAATKIHIVKEILVQISVKKSTT